MGSRHCEEEQRSKPEDIHLNWLASGKALAMTNTSFA
jgi:hypothetical protein